MPIGPGVSKWAYSSKNARNQLIEPDDKNSQIFTECLSRNKQSNKKWCAIPSSNEEEMTKISQSARDLDRLRQALIELKLLWRP